MIEHYRQIAIFAKTADHGSFRTAARALGLSPSVVSHHIARLEQQLGTALMYRSTRKLSLTRDGERLLQAAHAMIEAAEAGLLAVSDQAGAPSGELRVTAPAVLAHSQLTDRIAGFSNAHPKVHLQIDFSDARQELIGGGYDVAIRMGWLSDSALIAKKLYDAPRCVVASNTYAEARGVPQAPEDLAAWDWISLKPVQAINPVFRKAGDRDVTFKPKTRISVNDAHALCRLARAGAGLAIVPEALAEPYIADGSMQVVLPDWSVEPVGVFALWPANVPKHGLTKLFVDSLLDSRGNHPGKAPVST